MNNSDIFEDKERLIDTDNYLFTISKPEMVKNALSHYLETKDFRHPFVIIASNSDRYDFVSYLINDIHKAEPDSSYTCSCVKWNENFDKIQTSLSKLRDFDYYRDTITPQEAEGQKEEARKFFEHELSGKNPSYIILFGPEFESYLNWRNLSYIVFEY